MATPFSTCSRMTDWEESATSLVISTPRFIGPGWRTIIFLSRESRMALVKPYCIMYSLNEGKYLISCRSNWIRSILATSHQFSASIRLLLTLTPNEEMYLGIKVVGPQTITSAPSLWRQKMFDKATLDRKS